MSLEHVFGDRFADKVAMVQKARQFLYVLAMLDVIPAEVFHRLGSDKGDLWDDLCYAVYDAYYAINPHMRC